MQMRSRQRGAGMFRLFYILGTLAIFGIVGAKVFPLYTDYFKVKKAVNGVASEGNPDPAAVRGALERRWMVDDITGIGPADVKVQRDEKGKVSLVYDYETSVPLFYNISILLTFSGGAPLSGQ